MLIHAASNLKFGAFAGWRWACPYQFTVGYPNVQAPYTRGLTITYDVDGTEKSWSGNSTFKAFILGGLPTGNNFVTQGPDEILMVLRDAPGTGSSTAMVA